MTLEPIPGSDLTASAPPPTGWRKYVRESENLVLTICLLLLVVIPLAEIFLRRFFQTGISNSSALVQHLSLVIGMVGGAVAAREGRLLSLSTLSSFLKGHWQAGARIFSSAVAAAICFYLAYASYQFVETNREATDKMLAYRIPLWVVQAVMPVGFGLITLRLCWHVGKWKHRLMAFLLAAGLVFFAAKTSIEPVRLVTPALIALLLATVLGAPVFTTLGGAALILFWGEALPIQNLPIDHYRLVVNPSLPSIPLFTLAGYFLAEGGASRRLVAVFQELFGHFRGGPAIATALVCAFFTSFTGASGVTILALGGLLMPVLIAARYSERDALGLLTGAGSLGLLFPPCLPLILYAIVANNSGADISMKEIFLGGLVPGLLLVVATALWGIWRQPKEGSRTKSFKAGEAGRAIWIAKWELMLPILALVALFSGWATPVEAAAVTALYAFLIETFIYRDLKIRRDVTRVATECGLLVGGILLILGVALGFTNYLVTMQVPDKMVEWVKATIHSPLMFLLVLNIFLLLVGCLMDIFSAIVVVVPLIIPMGVAFGIDPIHLGIIFLANLELGFLTPPVGMNLFLASYRFNKPMSEVTRSVLPVLGVMAVGVLLITYIPALSTTLPRWFK